MNNREFGNKGEDLACEYLIKNGYKILERNKHFSKLCEIDIIAKLKDKVVFVEVKTRKSNAFGSPMEAITKTKYHKIKAFQIDVIGITLEPILKIEHLRNV